MERQCEFCKSIEYFPKKFKEYVKIYHIHRRFFLSCNECIIENKFNISTTLCYNCIYFHMNKNEKGNKVYKVISQNKKCDFCGCNDIFIVKSGATAIYDFINNDNDDFFVDEKCKLLPKEYGIICNTCKLPKNYSIFRSCGSITRFNRFIFRKIIFLSKPVDCMICWNNIEFSNDPDDNYIINTAKNEKIKYKCKDKQTNKLLKVKIKDLRKEIISTYKPTNYLLPL